MQNHCIVVKIILSSHNKFKVYVFKKMYLKYNPTNLKLYQNSCFKVKIKYILITIHYITWVRYNAGPTLANKIEKDKSNRFSHFFQYPMLISKKLIGWDKNFMGWDKNFIGWDKNFIGWEKCLKDWNIFWDTSVSIISLQKWVI